MSESRHRPVSLRHPPSNPQWIKVLRTMASASLGASIAELITIPVDTAKVRLQMQGENQAAGMARTHLKYRGMVHTIYTISKEEGVRTLYRGLTAGIHRQLCFCGIRVGLYDQVRQFYGDSGDGKPKVLLKLAASCTTASTAVLLFQPTEVVKIRFQVAGSKNRYSGTLDAYAKIGKSEGIRGLWRGVTTNMARLSLCNCTEIVVYDLAKSYILHRDWMSDDVPLHFVAAFGAGFVTSLVASPVDVVKTRFMNSSIGAYRNPFHCAAQVLRCNGPTAFYKGFIPAFVRIGGWNVAFFLAYEQIKRILHTT